MKIFGNKLKELREQKKLTQSQLSVFFNVKNTTISSWETGTREPDQNTLIQIAKFFDVKTDYLLGLED